MAAEKPTLPDSTLPTENTVFSKMTAIANEIRELSGTSEAIGLDAMKTYVNEANNEVASQVELLAQAAAALEGKATGDGSNNEIDSLITDTMPSYTNERVSRIRQYAFASASKLQTVNFPNVTSIGSSAFYSCASLATISFPACTTIGSHAFCYCSGLTTASFPACTAIGNYAFGHCKGLTTVSFPAITTIGIRAFTKCSNLTTISFPAATIIDSWAFNECTKLSSIYLAGSSVCVLEDYNALAYTPYDDNEVQIDGTPYIYVPKSLLASYKTATNWVMYAKYFSSIEGGSDIITFTIDGIKYQADYAMTWYDWVNSEYNTGGYKILDRWSEVTDATGMYYIMVTGDMVIESNAEYNLEED